MADYNSDRTGSNIDLTLDKVDALDAKVQPTATGVDVKGDASFYEDTGTTAKMVWDASAESLSLPTLTTSKNLTSSKVASTYDPVAVFNSQAGTSKLRIDDASNSSATTRLFITHNYSRSSSGFSADNSAVGVSGITFDNGEIGLSTASAGNDVATKRVTVDSAGNVGIGTASPSAVLETNGGISFIAAKFKGYFTGRTGVIGGDNNGVWLGVGDDAYSQKNSITLQDLDNSVRFSTNSSERARIDSSGNLLVGKTALNYNNNGTGLLASGEAQFTATAINPLEINRKVSDGSIINFRKDGTTVGSIGNNHNTNQLSIFNASGSGVRFGGNELIPVKNAVSSDGGVDLGFSALRFRDLYLSGGVYLGGTDAANKLDDYETGTWTPTIFGSSVAGAYTYGNGHAVYTKVGRQVTVSCVLTNVTTTTAGSGYLKIGGLPFTKMVNAMFHGSGRVEQWNFGTNNTSFVVSFITASATNVLYFRGQESSGGGDDMLITDINSGATDIELTMTYFV